MEPWVSTANSAINKMYNNMCFITFGHIHDYVFEVGSVILFYIAQLNSAMT